MTRNLATLIVLWIVSTTGWFTMLVTNSHEELTHIWSIATIVTYASLALCLIFVVRHILDI